MDLLISQTFPFQNQSERPSIMQARWRFQLALFKIISMCEINSKYARIQESILSVRQCLPRGSRGFAS